MESKIVLPGKLSHILNWIYDTMRKLWCRSTKLKQQKEDLGETKERNEIKLLGAVYQRADTQKQPFEKLHVTVQYCTYQDGVLCNGSSHCLNKTNKTHEIIIANMHYTLYYKGPWDSIAKGTVFLGKAFNSLGVSPPRDIFAN